MRRTLRKTLFLGFGAIFCLWSGAYRLTRKIIGRRRSPCIYILGFHRVLPDRIVRRNNCRQAMVISASTFEQMICYLKRKYQVVSLREVQEILRGSQTCSTDVVALTFDDGYYDNYQVAFPILQKQRLPATIFLVADYVGSRRNFWWDEVQELLSHADGALQRLAEENGTYPAAIQSLLRNIHEANSLARKRLIDRFVSALKHLPQDTRESILSDLRSHVQLHPSRFARHRLLSWNEVKEMHAAGVDFGAHSRSHVSLNDIPLPQVREEITGSKEIIESNLSQPVRWFAYPSGRVSEMTKHLMRESAIALGFTTAFGHNRGDSDPLALKRINMAEELVTGLRGHFSRWAFLACLFGLGSRPLLSLFKPKDDAIFK